MIEGTITVNARDDDEENFDVFNTTGIEFNNVTIWNFERGFSVEGSGVALHWDITGTRINHCTIVECRYPIYLNSQNCDFTKITDSRIGSIIGGFGIYMERVGIITMDSVLGAGAVEQMPPHAPLSDTFIYLTAAHGTVTISGSECDGFIRSMQVTSLAVGNFAWPILLLNNTFGETVALQSQCEIVSIGNRYFLDTVQCDTQTSATIYSFGDAIIGLNKVLTPSADFHLNNSPSRLASRANHYRVDFQRPARFGGRAGFITPIERTTLPLAVSAFANGAAQVSLCDEEKAMRSSPCAPMPIFSTLNWVTRAKD